MKAAGLLETGCFVIVSTESVVVEYIVIDDFYLSCIQVDRGL